MTGGPRTVDASRTAVRAAGREDAVAVASAVGALLRELGGSVPHEATMREEARAAIEDETVGLVLVAETRATDPASASRLDGVLAASWGRAMHVPGRYLTIQDLWVRPERRGAGVGAALVEALASRARAADAARIEVGLPRETFAGVARTERFYGENGFAPLGPRMRRIL